MFTRFGRVKIAVAKETRDGETRVAMVPELVGKLTALGYDVLGVMEKHLEGNDFFVGGRYSVADIALYAYTHVADEGASILRTSGQSACGWSASRRNRNTYR